ncbi:MAG: hypothetical protein JSS20_01270 [Proteobacteria bacterium]|nr:hypothetical protein [Pseudomonadota bacterium]
MLHALLAKAKAEGWTADQVFAEAQKIGAPINDEGFKAFVRRVTNA